MESWKIKEMLKELDPEEKVLSIKVINEDELELVDENGEIFYLISI